MEPNRIILLATTVGIMLLATLLHAWLTRLQPEPHADKAIRLLLHTLLRLDKIDDNNYVRTLWAWHSVERVTVYTIQQCVTVAGSRELKVVQALTVLQDAARASMLHETLVEKLRALRHGDKKVVAQQLPSVYLTEPSLN